MVTNHTMKTIFKVEIDCTNCANKIEELIERKLGVECNINFMTQKMIIEREDEIDVEDILAIGKKVDRDFQILRKKKTSFLGG